LVSPTQGSPPVPTPAVVETRTRRRWERARASKQKKHSHFEKTPAKAAAGIPSQTSKSPRGPAQGRSSEQDPKKKRAGGRSMASRREKKKTPLQWGFFASQKKFASTHKNLRPRTKRSDPEGRNLWGTLLPKGPDRGSFVFNRAPWENRKQIQNESMGGPAPGPFRRWLARFGRGRVVFLIWPRDLAGNIFAPFVEKKKGAVGLRSFPQNTFFFCAPKGLHGLRWAIVGRRHWLFRVCQTRRAPRGGFFHFLGKPFLRGTPLRGFGFCFLFALFPGFCCWFGEEKKGKKNDGAELDPMGGGDQKPRGGGGELTQIKWGETPSPQIEPRPNFCRPGVLWISLVFPKFGFWPLGH